MSDPTAPSGGFLRVVRNSLPAIVLGAGASAVFLAAFILVVGLDPGSTIALLGAILVVSGVAYRLIFGSLRGLDRIPVRRAVVAAAVGVVVVVGLAQAIPYGRSHTNPPVVSEPAWDSPRTRELVKAACFECHSYESAYPGYSNVAPISWALTQHISRGRQAMNFSDWANSSLTATYIAEVLSEGRMPPWNFRLLHPEARLTAAEKQELIDGLRATLGD
jgi:mono/diheme cytochrome c family protein